MSTTNEQKKEIIRNVFDRLINHYKLRDLDGLCRLLDVKYSTLKGWERRGNIADVEPFLFKCQGINLDWLKTGEGPMFIPAIGEGIFATKTNLVPVYGVVPAGWPEDTTDGEILGWIPVDGSTHGLAGLRVEGHSMSPEIKDGDYVLYKNDYDLRPGDIIIATNEFNSAMVKKYALKDGEPWLISINPEYPAFKVNDHYRIIGRVIERISKEKIGRQ